MTDDLDHVGRILAQWARERPDLDVSPMGIIGRLHRLGGYLDDELRAVMREHGLGDGEFDVLATLRRSGAPYELTPGELAASAMVTGGAITKRVDRCAARGLVRRRVSDDDARGRVITLTEPGRELIERALEAHVANEHRLVAGLGEEERAALARLLERWGRTLGV